MSRLAKKSIPIPQGVTISTEVDFVAVKGPKGEKKLPILPHTEVTISADALNVKSNDDNRQAAANCGTMWSLTKNAIVGVTEGFSKSLEIQGVGFRAALEGKTLVLNLGFVNPVQYETPEGVSIAVEKNVIKISGIDKDAVGRTAAQIRDFKKPEPYKGKGIRYAGEVVKIKAGKKAATAAA